MSVRRAGPGEILRARSLHGSGVIPEEAEWWVDEGLHPRPRFLASAVVWAGGTRFLLAVLPGVERQAAAALLNRVIEESPPAGVLRFDSLLDPADPFHGMLLQRGFEPVHRVDDFELPVERLRPRLEAVFRRARRRMPQEWQRVPLPARSSAEVRALVVDRFRLMSPLDFEHKARGGHFDVRSSVLLCSRGRLIGALLIVRGSDALQIAAIAVNLPPGRLRSMANLALLHGSLESRAAEEHLSCYRFQAGQHVHRQTANTALRLGGRQVASRFSLERDPRC